MEVSDRKRMDCSPEDAQQLQQLRTQLQNNIQQSRAAHHNFEPVSLPGSQPVSRVTSRTRRHLQAGSGNASSQPSPPSSAVHSPPLTPAATQSKDAVKPVLQPPSIPKDVMTPQRSSSPQRTHGSDVPTSQPRQISATLSGSGQNTQPPSKDTSAAVTPVSTKSGAPSHILLPQPKISAPPENDDAQYRFGNRDPAAGYANSGIPSATPPAISNYSSSSTAAPPLKTPKEEGRGSKRTSFFGAVRYGHDEESGKVGDKGHHSSSKSNLKHSSRLVTTKLIKKKMVTRQEMHRIKTATHAHPRRKRV